MRKRIRLAIDAMGGDFAPRSVVEGLTLVLARHGQEVEFLVFGDQEKVEAELRRYEGLADVVQVIHCDGVVDANDSPAKSVRTRRNSSMYQAIQAVKKKQAQAAISAGNTGALMAMALVVLRCLPGITRPAMVSSFPTSSRICSMLDLGANVECDTTNLAQFAVMGDLYARIVHGAVDPSVGLINVGVEQSKGREEVREAGEILAQKEFPVNYRGYIEGDQILQGMADVVVTDGFSGNLVLKAMEGVSRLVVHHMKAIRKGGLREKIGGLLLRRSLRRLSHTYDPRSYNGAVMLGLNGLVVKSHGGSDGLAFANAVGQAVNMVEHKLVDRMHDRISQTAGLIRPYVGA